MKTDTLITTGNTRTTAVGATRRVAVVITALIAALAAILGTSSSASASAFGGSGWGWVTYAGKGAPSGIYYAEINGSGTYVNYVKGWPQMTTPVSGNICNWSMTAEFFDASGRWYRTVQGGTNYGCWSYWNQANANVLWIRGNVAKGKMCSTLKSNGSRVTSVCHSIY